MIPGDETSVLDTFFVANVKYSLEQYSVPAFTYVILCLAAYPESE